MKKEEKAKRIGVILDRLYPKPPIPLDHTNGFTLLIAVLLSAQTTDKRVNMVTTKLFAEADSAEAMCKLSEDDILEIIHTVGLAPTKSKHIAALSKIIVEKFNGEIPDNLNDLKTLPGVGQKTASVVMSQWFGVPAFPVDTHIHRLAKRWGLTDANANVRKAELDLKEVFPEESWNRRHLQIIYYGREYCPARRHDKEECEICRKVAEWDSEK